MTHEKAIKILGNVSLDYTGMNQEEIDQMDEALTLAIKALGILNDVDYKVYRNESCDRAGRCDDYIGWHCTGCNGAKEEENHG